MPREVSWEYANNWFWLDIQVIEKNIHLENQKWTEKTISQRYEIDYHKRAIN